MAARGSESRRVSRFSPGQHTVALTKFKSRPIRPTRFPDVLLRGCAHAARLWLRRTRTGSFRGHLLQAIAKPGKHLNHPGISRRGLPYSVENRESSRITQTNQCFGGSNSEREVSSVERPGQSI